LTTGRRARSVRREGALVNLAKQAAIEHAPDGVRVNVVSPSATDTGLFMQVAAQTADPDAIINMVASRNPMGRLGTAAEVCDAVAFLASDRSTYISGTVLALDGAMAARRVRARADARTQPDGPAGDDTVRRLAASSVQALGADRVVRASDFPHPDAEYPGAVGEFLEHANTLDQAALDAVFWSTPLSFYQLESRFK
jgi:hypothetical protein